MSQPEDYRNYERRVREVLERRIREECAATQIEVLHDKKYKGASGHDHQIDVSAEIILAGCRILILVECKKYRNRVTISDVLELVGRIKDIGAHKGTFVRAVRHH